MRATHQRRCGFSLFEVMVAIALMIALLGGLFGFLFDMLATRRQVTAFARVHRAARTMIEQIETDLMTCIAADSSGQAGVRGSETTLQIISRGVPAYLAGGEATASSLLADQQVSEYLWDESSNQVTLRRRSAGASSGEGRPNFAELGGPMRVRFRFLFDGQWQSSFNSAQEGMLPAAVEIAIWFNPPEPEEDPAIAFESNEQTEFDDPFAAAVLDDADAAPMTGSRRPDELADAEGPPPDRVRVIAIPDAGMTP